MFYSDLFTQNLYVNDLGFQPDHSSKTMSISGSVLALTPSVAVPLTLAVHG